MVLWMGLYMEVTQVWKSSMMLVSNWLAWSCIPYLSQLTKKQPMNFKLFNIGETLSPMYRLATTREVEDHRKELLRTMPRWKIAKIANGTVDGAAHGGHPRMEWRGSVGHQLAVLEPMKFKLFRIGENIPLLYSLATIQDVQHYREEFLRTMPRWEIANLADGFVDGALYGGRTRYVTR